MPYLTLDEWAAVPHNLNVDEPVQQLTGHTVAVQSPGPAFEPDVATDVEVSMLIVRACDTCGQPGDVNLGVCPAGHPVRVVDLGVVHRTVQRPRRPSLTGWVGMRARAAVWAVFGRPAANRRIRLENQRHTAATS